MTFDRAADARRYEVVSGPFDEALFAAAELRAADQVLDVGCGYGSTTLRAAERAAFVVGNDVVEPMLVHARAVARGVTNVRFDVGDAASHPFAAGAFDVVMSRFGTMFFADPVAAFKNLRRASVDGGRLVYVTVGPSDRNDLPAVIAAATGATGLVDPPDQRAILAAAGYRDVDVALVETTIDLGPEPVDFIREWGAFRGLASDDVAVRAALTTALTPFRTPKGTCLRSAAWLVRAYA